MSFLSLSHELIEGIASYLRAQDLAALVLSCRQFRDVVYNSLLLQYTYHTELAGVYDPLWDLAARSIPDRMDLLRRWEASWSDLGRYLAAPQLVIPAERDLYGPFFLCDDYLFAVDWQGQPAGLRQPALLYVDLRDALRTAQYLWKQIDYPQGSIAITQAFSIEEDDLVVSVLSLPRIDNEPTKTILRFMSLETGGAHPLAREPDIQLDTTLPVNLLDVRADVIGDQIVLVLVDLRIDDPESDAIYLVDWKQGRMTLVHRAPNGTYEGALAVLSSDLVLFLKRDPPSIELCRVTGPSPSPRGGSLSNDNDVSTPTPALTPSLRVVCTLALPAFHDDYRVHTAYMQTDRHIERWHELEALSQGQEGVRPMRAPAPLPFHSSPEDMVVGITFLLRLRGPLAVWKKVVTTVSHRALLVLAAAEGHPPYDWHWGLDGTNTIHVDGTGGRRAEGKGQEQVMMVPWEEWGPKSARVIAPSSFQWITAHAGQRWLSLESDKLVMRDFSAARVRRARIRASSHRIHASTNPPDGNKKRNEGDAVDTQTVVKGGPGTCFRDDVVTSLPFLETRVDTRERARDMVLTDGERLVAFVRGGQPPTFDIHVLEDEESPTTKRPFSGSWYLSAPVFSPTGSRTPRSRSRTRGDTAVLANGSASYQLA